MGIFDFLYKDPSKKAGRILGQVPGQLHPYYDPYVEAGQRALPTLEEQYGQLLGDPSKLIEKIGASYTESPGFEFQKDQAMKAAQSAAAAGGYTGSPQDQFRQGQLASNLASQDYNKYLANALGMYQTGLRGMGGLEQQGYGAATDLAQSLANVLGGQAQMKYQGTAARNKMIGDLLGGLLQAGGQYAGTQAGSSAISSAMGAV